jgi:ubiquinone/menaquinone biosynthesis C-methylase UbiE
MKLNTIEFKDMNKPLRRFVQKYVEFKIFKDFMKRHNVNLTGKVILDAGCGSGYSTELIHKQLKPSRLLAIDFMPEQISLALQRKIPAEFTVGDVTNLELESNSIDGAFAFLIMHHVPQWREGLKEICRVLKPGGVFLVEEPNKEAVDYADTKKGYSHPPEGRFSFEEFSQALRDAGFEILEEKRWSKFNQSWICRKK